MSWLWIHSNLKVLFSSNPSFFLDSWSTFLYFWESWKFFSLGLYCVFICYVYVSCLTFEWALTFGNTVNEWNPQCPLLNSLTQLLQIHVFSYAVNPSHIWPSFFLLPSLFPSIIIFPKELCLLMTYPNKVGQLQNCHFCL